MNKDTVKGNIDKVVGTVKRKSGELTGDRKLQVKGAVQQTRGEIRNAVGQVKDAARDANRNPDPGLPAKRSSGL